MKVKQIFFLHFLIVCQEEVTAFSSSSDLCDLNLHNKNVIMVTLPPKINLEKLTLAIMLSTLITLKFYL